LIQKDTDSDIERRNIWSVAKGWMDGWRDRWMDGWMDGDIDRWMEK